MATASKRQVGERESLLIRCNDCGGTLIYKETAEGYLVFHSCKDGKQVREMTPSIWHQRNAEFALTDSAELREADAFIETLQKKIKSLEAALKTANGDSTTRSPAQSGLPQNESRSAHATPRATTAGERADTSSGNISAVPQPKEHVGER